MLLTRDKINLTHFSSRKRYIKDESGAVVGSVYDRLLIGLRVDGRDWLESHYNRGEIVTVFMLGDKNVVFTYKKDSDVLLVNRNAGSQALEYAHWWSDNNNCEMQFVDDLPTVIKTRNTTGGAKTLEDLINKASEESNIDCGL